MAVATEVVARFTADISDVQSKMAAARGAFSAVGEAATFSSKRIAEVGQTMADVGAKMTVGLTLPLGGLALAASKSAMSFETGMTKIIGLVGIATDEVARMGDEVLAMASATGKAPDELADGLFVVTSAGLRGSEAMAALANSAKAGAAGLGQTNDIARAVAGALQAYGTDVLSASDATDAIVATARAGNFETSQFAAAIGRVLPFAKQAGASFQDMGGAVALLTRVNGNAAESITQIQALFRAFVVPTEEAKTALDEVGLSAQDLRDSIADKGLPATLDMLDKALGGNREQLGKLLGSSEAASAAFQILDANALTIQETFGGVANSAGMTAEAFGAVSGTAQFQVSQAMAELKATLISLGEQFLPIIKSVMDFMQANLRAFNSLPGPIKTTILMFGALLAALGPILFVVGKLIVVFSTLLAAMLKLKAIQTLRAGFLALRGELAASRAAMKQTQTSIGMLGTAATTAKVAVVGSFKAIGAAAKGLLASLGPIGLAMLAVGAAVEIFIGRAAATEHHLSNLRDEIDLTTGKMTEAAKIFIASELRHNISQEDLAMMEGYGITISGFIAALEQGGPALDAYRDKFTAMQEAQKASGGIGDTGFLNVGTVNSINTIVGTLDGMIEQYDNAKVAAQDAADSQVDAAVAVSDAQRGLAADHRALAQEKRAADRAMTDSQRSLDKALDAGVEAVEALSSAFQKMNEVISQEASRDSAIQGIKDLNATLEENGTALKGTSDAAMDNRAAIRDAAQGWIDYAAAAKDPEEAQKRLAKGQDEIRAALKKAGIKPEESDIFKVFKKQQSESQKTVDEFAAQREKASQYGNDVGMNFIDGILAELERRADEVAAAAAAVTSNLTTGGNAGIDATSPSRDAMMVAGNFVDGLVIGLQTRAGQASRAASAVARAFTRSFMKEMFPKDMGAAESAIANAIANAEQNLADAREALKYANQQARYAEKELNQIRRDNEKAVKELEKAERRLARAEEELANAKTDEERAEAKRKVKDAEEALREARQANRKVARDLEAAENALARARREAAEASDAKKLAEWVQANEAALGALQKIGAQYDYIVGKMAIVQESVSGLSALLARPLGTESDLSQMFKFGTDPRTLARNFTALADSIRQAFAVLTDPKIVGRDAARQNKRLMNQTIAQLQAYVTRIMELQKEYEANAEQMRLNEEKWREDEARLSKALADATRNYEEALSRQKSIKDGFRSFINEIGSLTDGMVAAVKTQVTELANGVKLIVESADTTSAAGAIAANMQKRLAEVKEFSSNVKTLMERGLDPALIRDFVEAGVATSGKTIAALASATDDELRAINETQAELAKHAADFAEEYVPTADLKAAVDAATKALADAQAAYEAERTRLEAEQKRIEGDIALLVTQIEALVTNMMATLVPATEAAAQASIDAMIAQFEKDFPRLKKELGLLMDALARSMRRTVTIKVEADTSGVTGPGVTTRAGFTQGSVVVQTPASGRSVMVSPNAVSVNVTAGAGVDRSALTAQVKAAVDQSLQELAREIVSA